MAPSTVPSRAPTPPPNEDIEEEEVSEDIKPFRFFDLPSELRLRIYEEAFRVTERHVMELYEGKKRAGNIVGLDQRPDPPLDLGRRFATAVWQDSQLTNIYRAQRELVPRQTSTEPLEGQPPHAR